MHERVIKKFQANVEAWEHCGLYVGKRIGSYHRGSWYETTMTVCAPMPHGNAPSSHEQIFGQWLFPSRRISRVACRFMLKMKISISNKEEHRSRQWMRRLLATLIPLRYFDRWNSLPEGVMDLPEQDCKDVSLRSVQARPCGTGARCDRQCGHYLCYPATHVLIGRVGGQTSEVLWHCRADQHCSSCHACHACLPACLPAIQVFHRRRSRE